MQPSSDTKRLVEIMRALRDPATGCPWDIEQSFDTIVPYTIEETFEVVDAIERRDPEDLREELGDLLLQVVYYAQLAAEAGLGVRRGAQRHPDGRAVRGHAGGPERVGDGARAHSECGTAPRSPRRSRSAMSGGRSPCTSASDSSSSE